jgi:hypothetical protein
MPAAGDTYMLHKAERLLPQEQGVAVLRHCYIPSRADAAVVALRKWCVHPLHLLQLTCCDGSLLYLKMPMNRGQQKKMEKE